MKKNTNLQLIDDYESMRDAMDKAIERNDWDFVKNNLHKDTGSCNSLFYAVQQGHTAIFEYVFPLFSLPVQQKSVRDIASRGRMDYLDFALRYITVDTGDTKAHEYACRGNHFDMVKRLESLGIKKGKHSFTYALGSNNLSLIEHVYDEGEDISQYFNQQRHAMTLPVLKFVMSHTTLSIKNKEDVLRSAALAGFIDVIDFLLSEANPPSSRGDLFETVYYGKQLPTMKYLLTKAPILSDVSEDDYSAFIWAYEHGYRSFVNYLVNHHHVGPESSPYVLQAMQKDDFRLYHRVLKSQKKRYSKHHTID